MKIDSNQFINIKMIYDNSGSEISDIVPEIHPINGCDNTSWKFNVVKIYLLKKLYKDLSNLNLIKISGLNITLAEKLS